MLNHYQSSVSFCMKLKRTGTWSKRIDEQDLLKLHVADLHDIAYKVHVAPFHSPQINN